jgi:hypothetical protein
MLSVTIKPVIQSVAKLSVIILSVVIVILFVIYAKDQNQVCYAVSLY